MEPFIGQIQAFGFNFAPRGWAKCDGQLLQISTHTALFSLLGTIYGGDGRTTFALPDLRGRTPIHMGQGTGLSSHPIGSKSGTETVTLTTPQLPAHSHIAQLKGVGSGGTSSKPLDNSLAAGTSIYTNAAANQNMSASSIAVENTGNNAAHNNMQPYLTINWCIALIGIFPSRN